MNYYEKTALRERLVLVVHRLANIQALLAYHRKVETLPPDTLWLENSLVNEFYDDLCNLAEYAWRAEHMGHPSKDELFQFLEIDMAKNYDNRYARRLSELLAGEEN